MNESNQTTKPKSFSPKDPPKLDPPKDDPITVEALASFDGNQPTATTLIKHSDFERLSRYKIGSSHLRSNQGNGF